MGNSSPGGTPHERLILHWQAALPSFALPAYWSRVDVPELQASFLEGPVGDQEVFRLAETAGALLERDRPVHALVATSDPLSTSQWALDAIALPSIWPPVSASPVAIAVVDGGIDSGHPDVGGRVCVRGPDLTGSGWSPPLSAHGTLVAGIAAAETGNAVGIAGVANACLIDIRILDASGVGSASNLAWGIVHATKLGAKVILLSAGGTDLPKIVRAATFYAVAHGVLLVAAAGNDGCLSGLPGTTDTVEEPAKYPEVVSVASVGLHAGVVEPSWFSSCGSVDLAAPGEAVLSTDPPSTYATVSGTSFAAPHVAAAAVLVWAQAPDLSALQVRCALLAGASPVAGGPLPHDPQTGQGILQIAGAIGATHDPAALARCAATVGLSRFNVADPIP
ncbi:MAG TPA: S8 family serine peptidase [Candidatus Thermoplasmatota archaeon]|nr:S8 family serine peptidase [Candidatus Thermoplasmatota archaeon]